LAAISKVKQSMQAINIIEGEKTKILNLQHELIFNVMFNVISTVCLMESGMISIIVEQLQIPQARQKQNKPI